MSKVSWVLEEARKLVHIASAGKVVVFETGYGPSGLPHIGTFAEVVRTVMVMRALKAICPEAKTELLVVSDDFDGLRKVPDNVPNRSMLIEHLGKPLTSVPDPFGVCESYGSYMNSKLCEFLDGFGFQYFFKSSTLCYKSGVYDEKLLLILMHYNEIMDLMIPTLGDERQKTYSPFLPLCPDTGRVLQVKIESCDVCSGTVTYVNDSGELVETLVTGGKCKLQWKPDWAMRWAAFGVNYEMHGKDILPTALLSSKICRIIGSEPPINYMYELFLDEDGRKISKSKGNGLSVEDWMRYGGSESLMYFMYLNPWRAKRLCFDVIPRSVDEYLSLVSAYKENDIQSPVFYIHDGNAVEIDMCGLTFAMLINLANACNADNKEVLWGFITSYAPDANIISNSYLYKLCDHAIRYYKDFVAGQRECRSPSKCEAVALLLLRSRLCSIPKDSTAQDVQQLVYDVGKSTGYADDIKAWFNSLYEILLGASHGPKIGSFFVLYGLNRTVELIDSILGSVDNVCDI